jgi:hypothetical protein
LPQRNAVHVCRPAVPAAVHFRSKPPRVRDLYREIRAALRALGPVRVDSTRSRIAFRVLTIFLELTPQRGALRGHMVLPRAAPDPRFLRILSVSPRIHYHYFRLTDPAQIDARFRRLLAEARRVIGGREHLRPPAGRTSALAPLPGPARAGAPARRAAGSPGPLWRCPRCGWRFVSRNLAHSCARVPLKKHFEGKDPQVRRTFDALVAALRRNGPLTVVTSKTRITFMVRMRFAGVTPRKRSLPGGMGLMRPGVRHPLLTPGPVYGRIFGYRFRLTHPGQIDRGFRRLLAEAYRVGKQEHLGGPS